MDTEDAIRLKLALSGVKTTMKFSQKRITAICLEIRILFTVAGSGFPTLVSVFRVSKPRA
jgi:hypothetical protein